MFLPGPGPGSGSGAGAPNALKGPLESLGGVRDEVVAEVHRAPERRVDNMITRLYESAQLVHMHCAVAEEVRRRYVRDLWQQYALCASVLSAGPALATGAFLVGVGAWPTIALAALAVGAGAATTVYSRRTLKAAEEALGSRSGTDLCPPALALYRPAWGR